MSVAKKDNINPYEANWAKIAPRPAWNNPGYWEACRGLVPNVPREEA